MLYDFQAVSKNTAARCNEIVRIQSDGGSENSLVSKSRNGIQKTIRRGLHIGWVHPDMQPTKPNVAAGKTRMGDTAGRQFPTSRHQHEDGHVVRRDTMMKQVIMFIRDTCG